MKRNPIAIELEIIRREHGGILQPHLVVAFARDAETALHHRFEWDDARAAKTYRVQQARMILQTAVDVRPDGSRVRAYLPAITDGGKGDRYQVLADLLSDDRQRDRLLQSFFQDFRVFREHLAGKRKKRRGEQG